jgi:hypothetical protein
MTSIDILHEIPTVSQSGIRCPLKVWPTVETKMDKTYNLI